MKRGVVIVFLTAVGIVRLVAQERDCPAIVETALETTAAACASTSRNQACYGNINLEAELDPAVGELAFTQQGDIVDVAAVRTLRLSPLDEVLGEWGVALMKVQANLPDTLPGQNVSVLLFGDVEIENAAAALVKFPVNAASNINIRGRPSTNDAVIGSLATGESVIANGRLEDASWLRVELADKAIGWVFAQLVRSEEDLDRLAVVSAEDAVAPDFNPMQAFYFRSGVGDAPCAAAPESGILIQTPEGAGEITFNINEVNITLSSTAYLQAQTPGMMTIYSIENKAGVSAFGLTRTVVVGTQVQVPLDANRAASGPPGELMPYDTSRLMHLPLGYLERKVPLVDPLGSDEISALPTPTLLAVSQQDFADSTGDAIRCDNRQAADDPEVDIKEVMAQRLINGIEATKVDVVMQAPLVNDYSFAVMLVFLSGETYKVYLWEIHAGAFRIGAVDPQTGQLTADGTSQAEITHDRQAGIVSFKIPSSELPTNNLQLNIQSFHTPTAETQPQPTYCDRAGSVDLQ